MGFPGSTDIRLLARRMEENQETQVRSLCQKDPLEKEITTYSSILAWKILWTEEPVGLRPWGREESDTTYRLSNKKHFLYYLHLIFVFTVYIGAFPIHKFFYFFLLVINHWLEDVLGIKYILWSFGIKKIKIKRNSNPRKLLTGRFSVRCADWLE